MLATMIASIAIGYLYDILGRKNVLIILNLALGGAICALPHVWANTMYLTVVRTVISILVISIIGNPLMIDMIKEDSRGKGEAMQQSGGAAGELTSYKLTMELQKFLLDGIGFYVVGGLCGVLGFLSIFVFKNKIVEYEYRQRKDGSVIRVKKAKIPKLT